MPWFKRKVDATASPANLPPSTAHALPSGSAGERPIPGTQGAVTLNVEGEYRIKARLDLYSDRDVGSVIDAAVESGTLQVGRSLRLVPSDGSRSSLGPFEVLGIYKGLKPVREAEMGTRVLLQLRGFPRGNARKGDRLQG